MIRRLCKAGQAKRGRPVAGKGGHDPHTQGVTYMRRFTGWLCATLIAASGVPAQAADRSNKKDTFTFGVLQAPSEVQVRVQAANWLKEVGKYDARRADFDAVWSAADKSLLDKLSE